MNQKRKTCLLVILLFLPLFVFAQEQGLTTVILVRHAEKESDTENPHLSVAGRMRAADLAKMLESSGISAIYTSQYSRTIETAEPLAALLKIDAVQFDASRSNELVKRIFAEHSGKTIFVAGHSNTIPEIIAALGAKIPPIEDWQYDNLYVVTASQPGKATVLRLKFGEPEGGAR
jgi:broad specificity phosphatase PhoE